MERTNTQTDIADNRLNWPCGQFGEKPFFLNQNQGLTDTFCLFVFYLLSFSDILNPPTRQDLFLSKNFSWAPTVVTKGCPVFALLHTPVKCSPDKMLFFKEQFTKGAMSKVCRRAFWRERSLGLSKMLSLILWQNTLQIKIILRTRAFCQESILPKNMGEHF